ncbi:B12-binding domain-containing radical SAM protein [Dyella silvatica]|uniref:B12-binding domain-containing radical SAM protein n=1 Tax=Dyella silvatica TaxID=2992128 RepID=UPI00224E7B1C|nr:cobalamin-dependent protein [Dyella silvatica]
MTILLSTLNARYAHASLGLRYLMANAGELREQMELHEFVIGTKTTEIVEKLLARRSTDGITILGFGVYIWNVEETTRVVALIKRIAPEIVIVLGGPEVSYESAGQPIVEAADYVITGWGDVTFPELCRSILGGSAPAQKMHAGRQPPMAEIALPYNEYSATDLAQRTLYVEASRGCPFKWSRCMRAVRDCSSLLTARSISISKAVCASCSSFSTSSRRRRTIRCSPISNWCPITCRRR